MIVIEIAGWIGSACILAAYGLNSYHKIKSGSLIFYGLNIAGGILLIVYSARKEAYANIFINIVWVGIAIPALINILRKRKPSVDALQKKPGDL